LVLLLWRASALPDSHASSGRRALSPVVGPAVCAGVTGLLLGTGIGIGLGALIFDRRWYYNRHHGHHGFGAGVWVGRRRRDLEREDAIVGDLVKAEEKWGDQE
jgi:hypothetical protein